MRRRNCFLKMAGLGAVSLSLPICATSALAEDSNPMTKPPNFILILSDDHGWSGTSVAMDPNNPDSKSDYIETPNLERLAARGECAETAQPSGCWSRCAEGLPQ